MKIAILGYGKMGKVIERVAETRDHEVPLKATSEAPPVGEDLARTDVAIDFSVPSAAPENIRLCFEKGIPVVVGTTGWDAEKEELFRECEEKKGTLFYAPNFSLGVNILFAVNEKLGQFMEQAPDYDVAIEETHHTEKLDAPSGTAIRIAEGIIEALTRKTRWVKEEGEEKSDLVVRSYRKNKVPGIHTVHYDSPVDEITIQHSAKSRDGFALGAVRAAEWVKGRSGLFTMKDMLDL